MKRPRIGGFFIGSNNLRDQRNAHPRKAALAHLSLIRGALLNVGYSPKDRSNRDVGLA